MPFGLTSFLKPRAVLSAFHTLAQPQIRDETPMRAVQQREKYSRGDQSLREGRGCREKPSAASFDMCGCLQLRAGKKEKYSYLAT